MSGMQDQNKDISNGSIVLFKASIASVSQDDYCWTVSLADDSIKPQHYMFVQLSKQVDAQNQNLDMDQLYFEFDGQIKGLYDGVTSIELSETVLHIILHQRVAIERKLPSMISIPLFLAKAQWEKFREALIFIAKEFVPIREIPHHSGLQ